MAEIVNNYKNKRVFFGKRDMGRCYEVDIYYCPYEKCHDCFAYKFKGDSPYGWGFDYYTLDGDILRFERYE